MFGKTVSATRYITHPLGGVSVGLALGLAFAFALGVALCFAGCVKQELLSRPPLLDMSRGTVSLSPIDHNGHKELAAAVRTAFDSAFLLVPRHSVEWVQSEGDLRIHIQIVAVNRNARDETFDSTCERPVPGKFVLECNERNVCSQVQAVEEIPCKQVERVQDASARFLVELREELGAVRFRHTYHISVAGSSFADRLMAGRLADQAVRLVSPWYHNPDGDKAAFSRQCKADSLNCAQAWDAFFAQEFNRAELLMNAELGAYADRMARVPPQEAAGVAKALCNRAIIREYQLKYDVALSDFRRAAVLGADRRCMVLLERLKNYSQARAAFGATRPAY